MSRIIFQDTYLIVIPSFGVVEKHSHPMLHMFYSSKKEKIVANQKELEGNIIFLDSNVEHIINKDNNCEIFFLFDPTSKLARRIREKYLDKDKQSAMKLDEYDELLYIREKSDEKVIECIDKYFTQLLMNNEDDEKSGDINRAKGKVNERVKSIIDRTKSGEFFQKSIKDIAAIYFISESRLLHEFKEQVGISLKNYILMRRLECAYKLVMNGKSITYAAMETNFSSPAHLAATCKKYTGISISGVFENSSFLKARNTLD